MMDGRTRPLGYERVYLPLCKVVDTAFHIQRDGCIFPAWENGHLDKADSTFKFCIRVTVVDTI